MSATATKPTVLIVEDDPNDLLLLHLALDGRFECRIVHTLAEAIVVLEQQIPEVILLDLGLPDSSYPYTLDKLKQIRGTAAIVIVSGNGDAAFVEQCILGTANGYLFKNQLTVASIGEEIGKALENNADYLKHQKALAIARNNVAETRKAG